MINQPLVSIVIAIYNQELFIRETLDSICNQTYKNLEIILVDDGSTDSTPAILKEYSAKDSRIRIISQQNKRAGAARNTGLAVASGAFVWFPDSDDLFSPDMVQQLVTCAEAEKSDIVICRAEELYEDGRVNPMPWQINKKMLKGVNTKSFRPSAQIPYSVFQFAIGWAWDKLFRMDFIKEHRLKYAEIHHAEDAVFVFPSLIFAHTVSVLDKVLVRYRKHENSVSASLNQVPTACCDAIDEIRNILQEKEVNSAIWSSFNSWAMHYLCWNLNGMSGETVQQFQNHIVSHYEPRHHFLCSFSEATEQLIPQKKLPHAYLQDLTLYKAMNNPSISIVVPTYNASKYLREAMDSLVVQTHKDFEVICVNDGSTDDSLDILQEYASKDPRFKVLNFPNGGYGKAMNRGMDAARGKYISILEPDDYYAPDTLQVLYQLAETHNLDIAKGAFERFYEKNGKKHFFSDCELQIGKILCPRKDLAAFKISMNTWTCLYRTSFLRSHNIRHNETPGASYQDNGLHMLSFSYADRVMCIPNTVYYYRQDNQNSSINALCKRPYAMRDEYKYIRERLQQDAELWKQVEPAYVLKRMDNHMYVYNSILDSIKMEYLEDFRKELITMEQMDWSLIPEQYKQIMKSMLIHPLVYLFDERLQTRLENNTCIKRNTQRQVKSSPKGIVSWFYSRNQFKTTIKFFGIPLYSRNKKNGRKIYRILGIKVFTKLAS